MFRPFDQYFADISDVIIVVVVVIIIVFIVAPQGFNSVTVATLVVTHIEVVKTLAQALREFLKLVGTIKFSDGPVVVLAVDKIFEAHSQQPEPAPVGDCAMVGQGIVLERHQVVDSMQAQAALIAKQPRHHCALCVLRRTLRNRATDAALAAEEEGRRRVGNKLGDGLIGQDEDSEAHLLRRRALQDGQDGVEHAHHLAHKPTPVGAQSTRECLELTGLPFVEHGDALPATARGEHRYVARERRATR
mmetsp:Transcript_26915/g.63070  ORF Transcript_26915/g.63070 Transcript_26915/m.63070 type:complete len:247 (+) Transcript_26915:32-772(+)